VSDNGDDTREDGCSCRVMPLMDEADEKTASKSGATLSG
jgi:hypothetical protein